MIAFFWVLMVATAVASVLCAVLAVILFKRGNRLAAAVLIACALVNAGLFALQKQVLVSVELRDKGAKQ